MAVDHNGGRRRREATLFVLIAVAICSAVVAVRVAAIVILDPALATATAEAVKAINAQGWYPNLVSLAGAAFSRPFLIGVFFYAGAPTLAAVFLAARIGGVGALLARLRPWGPGAARKGWYWTYVALAGVYAAGIGFYLLAIGNSHSLLRFGSSPALAALGLLVAPFIDEGGTLEELGWRGYLFPRLDQGQGWLGPALLVGAIHWAWHLPREVLTFIQGVDPLVFLSNQSVFAALCLALGVLCGLSVKASGGSALPAILIHGGTNAWSKGLDWGNAAAIWRSVDIRTAVVIVLAFVVLAIYATGKLRFGSEPSPV